MWGGTSASLSYQGGESEMAQIPARFGETQPEPGCGVAMMIAGAIMGVVGLFVLSGSPAISVVLFVVGGLIIPLGCLSYVVTSRQTRR